MKDWRPIALFYVVYKIVAKVLANILKQVLDKCISINQSAFVPGRSILDNAMVAIEIVHLLFAEECFLFFRACEQEAVCMKNILATYEEASEQAINLQKSKLYCSRNTPDDLKNLISTTLGVRQVLVTGKYLGLPSMIGHSKHATFKFIKDRRLEGRFSLSLFCNLSLSM